MKKLKILGLFLFVLIQASAQTKSLDNLPGAHRTYTIGDTIPDIVLTGLLDDDKSKMNLTELRKGKLLILDFWATWCVPCVKALPLLHNLQRKFINQVLFIPVSEESREVVTNFLSKNANLNDGELLFLTGDRSLTLWFPHRGLPHEVWINSEGVVQAITQAEEVNEINISKALTRKFNLPVKIDDMAFDLDKPLFVNGNGGTGENFISRSILSKTIAGVSGGDHREIEANGNMKRFVVSNRPLLLIFQTAFSKGVNGMFNSHTTVFNGIDTVGLKWPKKGQGATVMAEWSRKNSFCYDLILPNPVPQDKFYEIMLADLNRSQSRIEVTVEKRTGPCWTVVRTNIKEDLLRSKSVEKSGVHTGKARNIPLSSLIYFLNGYNNIEPVFDETGYSFPVDMDLDFIKDNHQQTYPDISAIRRTLNRYGLDMIKGERKIDMMIISKKENYDNGIAGIVK